MGSSGLEPPTSRLSGVRSNHLSYAPIMLYITALKLFVLPSSLGGDEENRTPDPLLAKQVLSQLSYTPIALLLLFSIFRFLSGILKIEQCLSLLSYFSLSLTF